MINKICLLALLILSMFFQPMDKCLCQDNSEADVLALSKMIGDTLDTVESEKYGLFRTIEGYQSADNQHQIQTW